MLLSWLLWVSSALAYNTVDTLIILNHVCESNTPWIAIEADPLLKQSDIEQRIQSIRSTQNLASAVYFIPPNQLEDFITTAQAKCLANITLLGTEPVNTPMTVILTNQNPFMSKRADIEEHTGDQQKQDSETESRKPTNFLRVFTVPLITGLLISFGILIPITIIGFRALLGIKPPYQFTQTQRGVTAKKLQ